jgi:hypothetical protein
MLQQGIMALPYNGVIDYDDAAGVDLDQSPADVGHFIVPMKCEIIEVGAVVTETCVGSSATPEMSFDLRPAAGSDTNRSEIGLLKFLTAAQGKVVYDKAPKGTILYPGQEIVAEVKTQAVGSAAGHARPYVLVKPLDETKANLANMVETT